MRRATAVLGSGVFFVIAPGVVAGLIPWWITRWQFMPPFLNMELTRVMGFLLMLAGVPAFYYWTTSAQATVVKKG